MRGISLLAENLLASQEGICSMELVIYFNVCENIPILLKISRNLVLLNAILSSYFLISYDL
jgi:hypothetical protein